MNFDSFLQSLTERDSIKDSTGFWDISVKLSNSFAENNPYYKELNRDVSEIQHNVENLEQELMSNTEAGQKMRQIQTLSQAVENEKQKLESQTLDESLLKEEVKNLTEEIRPLREKSSSINQQIQKLKETTESLELELNNKNDQQFFCKKSLDQIVEEYASLKTNEEKMITQLMKLKTREMDIRNQEVPQTNVNQPKIDYSRYKAPLPNPGEGASLSDDEILGGSAPAKVERVPFLSSLKQEPSTQKHAGSVTALCFANTQPYLASGAEDSTVHIVRTDNFLKTTTLRDSPKTIMAINFSPSDRTMLTASFDGVVRFYRIPDFKLINTNSDNRDCVTSSVFLTDEKFITCCRDQTIKLFDISRSSPVVSLSTPSTAHCVFPLQGESLIITSHHDGKIRGYDLRAQGSPFEIRVHKKQAIQVTGRLGGTKVASLSVDKTIAVIDIRGKVVLGSINIQKAGMPSDKMQMALVDKSAIIGSTSGDLYDYDLMSYKLHSTVKGPNAPVLCVAANESMGLLSIGDKNGVVQIWNQSKV